MRFSKSVGRWSCAVTVLMLQGAIVFAQEIPNGATESQVIDALGKPRGRLKTGDMTLFSYDRGMVTFVNGCVTTNTLVTSAEAQQKAAERAQQDAARLAAQEEARLARIAAGRAELEKMTNNPAFARRSAADRVAYWEGFRTRYPEVPVDQELAGAKSQLPPPVAAADPRQAEREALTKRIDDLKAQLEKLAPGSGMGKVPFVTGSRQYAELRDQLRALQEQQKALDGK